MLFPKIDHCKSQFNMVNFLFTYFIPWLHWIWDTTAEQEARLKNNLVQWDYELTHWSQYRDWRRVLSIAQMAMERWIPFLFWLLDIGIHYMAAGIDNCFAASNQRRNIIDPKRIQLDRTDKRNLRHEPGFEREASDRKTTWACPRGYRPNTWHGLQRTGNMRFQNMRWMFSNIRFSDKLLEIFVAHLAGSSWWRNSGYFFQLPCGGGTLFSWFFYIDSELPLRKLLPWYGR